MKRVIANLLLLILTLPCPADVKIGRDHRIPNRGNGYCVWCSVETIGRYKKYPNLYGLVDYYAQWPSVGATPEDAGNQLQKLGVDYEVSYGKTLRWLKRKTDAGVPVVIFIPGHAVVAVDVDVQGNFIKTVDCNWVEGYSWYKSSDWLGMAVEIK